MSASNTTPPNTAYRNAGKVFADFLEADQRRGRGLTIVAILLFVGLIGSNFTMAYMYGQRRETIAMVEVDGNTGQIIRKYQPEDYRPSDLQKSYVAREWIKLVRRRPADVLVMRDDLLWVYAHTAGGARERLDSLFRAQAPLEDANLRVIRDLTAFSKSSDSYQLTWHEDVYTPSGTKIGTSEQSGLLTIAMREGVGADLTRNPIELYVVHFDWTVPTPTAAK